METVEQIQLAELVHLAAGFMDDAHPGWARKIDTSDLWMVNPNKCVAGQNNLDWKKVSHAFGEWANIDLNDALDAFANGVDFWKIEVQARRS